MEQNVKQIRRVTNVTAHDLDSWIKKKILMETSANIDVASGRGLLSEKGITIRFWKAIRDILQANTNCALPTNIHEPRWAEETEWLET
jgi:hypothetical protein